MKQAKIENLRLDDNLDTLTTRITIEMTRMEEIDCPMPPRTAYIGPDWIMLCGDSSPNHEDALEPEGVAMQLLRLAWVAAHAEQTEKQKPFDGDARPFWEKD